MDFPTSVPDSCKDLVVRAEINFFLQAPAGLVCLNAIGDVHQEVVLRVPPQFTLRLVSRSEEVIGPACNAIISDD